MFLARIFYIKNNISQTVVFIKNTQKEIFNEINKLEKRMHLVNAKISGHYIKELVKPVDFNQER